MDFQTKQHPQAVRPLPHPRSGYPQHPVQSAHVHPALKLHTPYDSPRRPAPSVPNHGQHPGYISYHQPMHPSQALNLHMMSTPKITPNDVVIFATTDQDCFLRVNISNLPSTAAIKETILARLHVADDDLSYCAWFKTGLRNDDNVPLTDEELWRLCVTLRPTDAIDWAIFARIDPAIGARLSSVGPSAASENAIRRQTSTPSLRSPSSPIGPLPTNISSGVSVSSLLSPTDRMSEFGEMNHALSMPSTSWPLLDPRLQQRRPDSSRYDAQVQESLLNRNSIYHDHARRPSISSVQSVHLPRKVPSNSSLNAAYRHPPPPPDPRMRYARPNLPPRHVTENNFDHHRDQMLFHDPALRAPKSQTDLQRRQQQQHQQHQQLSRYPHIESPPLHTHAPRVATDSAVYPYTHETRGGYLPHRPATSTGFYPDSPGGSQPQVGHQSQLRKSSGDKYHPESEFRQADHPTSLYPGQGLHVKTRVDEESHSSTRSSASASAPATPASLLAAQAADEASRHPERQMSSSSADERTILPSLGEGTITHKDSQHIQQMFKTMQIEEEDDDDGGMGNATYIVGPQHTTPQVSPPAPLRESPNRTGLRVVTAEPSIPELSSSFPLDSTRLNRRDQSPVSNKRVVKPGNLSPTGLSRHVSIADRQEKLKDNWAPRPKIEEVLDNLDEFFPTHDLEKPVFDAVPEISVPTTIPENETLADEPKYDEDKIIPVPGRENRNSWALRHKQSVRVAAAARRRGLERSQRFPVSSEEKVMRRKSTKLFGFKIEEVTPDKIKEMQIQETLPEEPKAGAVSFKWIKGSLIGRGSYGKVYLGFNVTSGDTMAVKQVELPRILSDQHDTRLNAMVSSLKSEISCLQHLSHDNIVEFLGVEQTPEHLSIFLEYVPGGSVARMIRIFGKFPEEVIKSFTRQMVEGIAYLHGQKILHRDLKADNILCDQDGVIKISDFGTSKRTDAVYADFEHSMQGTFYWMAPEVMISSGSGYSAKADVWSLGCIVLEMFSGRRPWDQKQLFEVMSSLSVNPRPPPIPEDVKLSQAAQAFLNYCFAIDANNRPRAEQLRRHIFLHPIDPNYSFANTALGKAIVSYNNGRKDEFPKKP